MKHNFSREFAVWFKKWHDALEIILTILAIIVAYFVLDRTADQVDVSQRALALSDSTFRYQRIQDSINERSQMLRDSLARDVAHYDIRAYIVFGEIRMENLLVGKTLVVDVLMKNVGKTPAYDCQAQVETHAQPSSNNTFFPSYSRPMMSPSIQTLGSGVTMHIPVSIRKPLTLAAIDSINNEKWKIFIYGKVKYKDIWGQFHFTNICQSYTKATGWIGYNKYNDAN